MTDLKALIASLEGARAGSRSLDLEVARALHQTRHVAAGTYLNYTTSLDAKLPGDDEAYWVIEGPLDSLRRTARGWFAHRVLGGSEGITTQGRGRTEALARRIASLKALAMR